MKKKILASLLAVCFLGLCVLLCFVIKEKNNKVMLEDKFLNKKSEYQGVITCYNIDSFESGKASKTSFLEKVAIEFEKQNRGLFVLVKNVTIDECLLAIDSGNMPDIISFGEKLYLDIRPYLSCSLKGKQLKTMVCGDRVDFSAAAPWCFGVYSVISTKEKLKLAGPEGERNLLAILDKCSYDKKLKKSTKHIQSFVYGGVVGSQIKTVIEDQLGHKIDDSNKTFFEAYESFVNGDASLLFGTQRDLARMDSKVKLGKIEDYVYSPITSFTDLIQYIGYTKSDNTLRNKKCEDFIEFLQSPNIQQKLGSIGMCAAICGVVANTDGTIAQIESNFY